MSKSNVTRMEKKSLDSSPDETITFEKGKVDVAKVGDISIGRGYFEPGWSWEKSIKPIAKTDTCQQSHTHYVISGRLKVALEDGTEEEIGPGDIAYVPPGHNSWVVGNEPLVIVDFSGFKGQSS
jgi:mannose-6-phosphate isomerase-like protein (cupin superfamily)